MNQTDFIMLEPLLSESLQEYLARHSRRLGDALPETHGLVARWRVGPAWLTEREKWHRAADAHDEVIR